MIAPSTAGSEVNERRSAPRLQPAYRTVCRLDQPGSGERPAVGLVWNLSRTGLSMLLPEPLKAGDDLAGELAPEAGGDGVPVQMRIVHVRHLSTGDYFLGARFLQPLEPAQVDTFLVAPGPDGFPPPDPASLKPPPREG